MENKIKSGREIEAIARDLKKKGKKIVTTNGAFDLFHYGHVLALKFAKSHGDVLIVGVNSDASIRKYKSEERPIIPESERIGIVAAIGYVDYAVLFYEKDPTDFLRLVKPDCHVKGAEYEGRIVEKEFVEENGGKVVFMKRIGKI